MMSFDFGAPSQVIFRAGSVRELPSILGLLKRKRALIVTDPGLMETGLVAHVQNSIDSSPTTRAFLFSKVKPNAPESVVYEAAEFGRDAEADIVIGLGGGSSMDAAKLIAYLLKYPAGSEANYGIEQGMDRLPLILIPTTSGTGSEVNSISLSQTNSGELRRIVSRKLFADIALLDTELTLLLPRHVTAAAGVDAIARAIEIYVSRSRKNLLTDMLAAKALRLLADNLPKVLHEPENLSAREGMLMGSMLAGMSSSNMPVTVMHAITCPLTTKYLIPSGVSTAVVLIPLLEHYANLASKEYSELATIVGGSARTAEKFIELMKKLLVDANLPVRLRDVGASKGDIQTLARDAMTLLDGNEFQMTLEDVVRLYEQAYSGALV